MKLSAKSQSIAPSMTLEIDAKAKKMKAEGIDVVGFGAGEPDFDTPSFIKQAAKDAIDKGMTKYTPASGTLELRQAICQKLKTQNGLDYSPAEIVASNGAKHSLFNAFAAIIDNGDEVIVPAPYWVTYPELIKYCGGVSVFVETSEETGFIPKIEDLKNAITDRTVAISINSPSNPTGAVYDEELLRQIGDLAVEHDLYIISDEIYEVLVYDDVKQVSIASLDPKYKERCILVNGFSKAYAMTGWRLGYTASPLAVSKVMNAMQSHMTSNPCSITQYAGTIALQGPKDEVIAMRNEFSKRREIMYNLINEIDGLSCTMPKGAFYILLNIKECIGKSINGKTIQHSMDFCAELLDVKKVAIVPGIAFGAEGYCRLSYAYGEDSIKKGMNRIAEFVSELA